MTKKDQKAAEVLANRRVAYAKKVATLTGHVAGRTSHAAMMAAFDANRTAEDYAAEIASAEPVGKALHPQKAEAVKAAAADAAVTIGWVQKRLEEYGMDIDKAAPYPSSFRMGRSEHQSAKALYSLFHSVTESVDKHRYVGRGEPRLVRMSDEGIARFIGHAEENAAAQYDAFICKMVAKIGDQAISAEISGSHVWDYSHLVVTLRSGEVQKWRTQQIWNYSVYGLRYPQWPSRKVK